MLHNLVHITDSRLRDTCGQKASCMNAQYLLLSMPLKGC